MSDSVYTASVEVPSKPDLKRGDVVRITDGEGRLWHLLIDDIQPAPGKLPLEQEPHILHGRAVPYVTVYRRRANFNLNGQLTSEREWTEQKPQGPSASRYAHLLAHTTSPFVFVQDTSKEWVDKAYSECLAQAGAQIRDGGPLKLQ